MGVNIIKERPKFSIRATAVFLTGGTPGMLSDLKLARRCCNPPAGQADTKLLDHIFICDA